MVYVGGIKLHILNDLHVEYEDFEPLETNANIIVLVGEYQCVEGGAALGGSQVSGQTGGLRAG